MIKIGVDARSLSLPITGVGRYTYDMCRQLALNPDLELILYSPAPILAEYREPFGHCRIVELKTPKNGIYRQIWGETFLPYWAGKDDVDILWGPSHRLPRFNPGRYKTVVSIHDLVWKIASETMKPLSKLRESLQMPPVVRSADKVVVSSKATIKDLHTHLNVPFDKMALVYPAIDIQPPEDLPNTLSSIDNLISSPKYILFVGTLEPRKNIKRLLEAYSNLDTSMRDEYHLVVVGSKGWGRYDFSEYVKQSGLDEYVHLMGYLDEQSLQYLYKNAYMLAMPSTYEGFGLPVAEAMKYGVPAIAGNNSSLVEVVGKAGLLVEATDINAIQEGLAQLLLDQSLYQTLAENTKHQITKFDAQQSAGDLIEIFMDLAKK